MNKINFYIGANNCTKKVEKDLALSILSDHYEGMSVSEIVGYWQGMKEDSILVSIMLEKIDLTTIKNVSKQLNRELNQQAIMIEILESNTMFISDR